MAVAENPADHDGRRQDGLLARELATATKDIIEDAIAWAKGNQARTSAILGCNKTSLWRWIKVYGIDLNAVEADARRGRWKYKTRPAGAPWSGVSVHKPTIPTTEA